MLVSPNITAHSTNLVNFGACFPSFLNKSIIPGLVLRHSFHIQAQIISCSSLYPFLIFPMPGNPSCSGYFIHLAKFGKRFHRRCTLYKLYSSPGSKVQFRICSAPQIDDRSRGEMIITDSVGISLPAPRSDRSNGLYLGLNEISLEPRQ